MAIKYYERYPQRWDSPSQDYPQGAFKNLSALGEQDGSYLEKDWLNDQAGFFGALLRNAEMTPNGEVDTAQRSQFYDALIKVAKESVDLSTYRKKDDLLFKGMFKVQATDDVAAGVFLQDTGGTVRGQVVATDQGLQLTQYPKDGGSQTFTFPNTGGEFATTSYVDAQIEAIPESDAVPIGMIQAYISETTPNDKWLLCRGQSFSAESYPVLSQLLPDLKIPDLRGVALRGLDANRGFDPNRELLSYQEDAMQKITGKFATTFADCDGVFSPNVKGRGLQFSGNTNNHGDILFDSSRVARSNTQNETTMKNVAVNFIIKAR